MTATQINMLFEVALVAGLIASTGLVIIAGFLTAAGLFYRINEQNLEHERMLRRQELDAEHDYERQRQTSSLTADAARAAAAEILIKRLNAQGKAGETKYQEPESEMPEMPAG